MVSMLFCREHVPRNRIHVLCITYCCLGLQVAGTVLKYTAPGDAAQPDKRWRLYVFKAETIVDQPIPIHR